MWSEATFGCAPGVDKEGVAVSGYLGVVGVSIDEKMVACRFDSCRDSLDKVARGSPAMHYAYAAAQYFSFSQFWNARGEATIIAIAQGAKEWFAADEGVIELWRDEVTRMNHEISFVDGGFEQGGERLRCLEVGIG